MLASYHFLWMIILFRYTDTRANLQHRLWTCIWAQGFTGNTTVHVIFSFCFQIAQAKLTVIAALAANKDGQ